MVRSSGRESEDEKRVSSLGCFWVSRLWRESFLSVLDWVNFYFVDFSSWSLLTLEAITIISAPSLNFGLNKTRWDDMFSVSSGACQFAEIFSLAPPPQKSEQKKTMKKKVKKIIKTRRKKGKHSRKWMNVKCADSPYIPLRDEEKAKKRTQQQTN